MLATRSIYSPHITSISELLNHPPHPWESAAIFFSGVKLPNRTEHVTSKNRAQQPTLAFGNSNIPAGRPGTSRNRYVFRKKARAHCQSTELIETSYTLRQPQLRG